MGEDKQKKDKPTQSTILIQLASSFCQFLHDDQDNGYVRINNGSCSEFHPVRSASFKKWLCHMFWVNEGKTPNSQALQDALNNIDGLCKYDGEPCKVSVRVGEFYGTIHLDQCDDTWNVITINTDQWGITKGWSPANHIRHKGMLSLPAPDPDGTLEDLRPFLNIDHDDSFILISAWLLGALRPNGPYPVLVLNGEQGSAKSTASRLFKSIIDPSASSYRSYPQTERDVVISAEGNHILVFDNLSGIGGWFSDALCRISTGGGYAIRKLYTDREEEVFTATRPIILNGIADIVYRHDLADRSIFITLPPIPDERRIREDQFWKDFKEAHPKILGGLLNAASVALRNFRTTHLKSLPRMADFAQWVVSAEEALPWEPGAFLRAYNANRASLHRAALDSDLFGSSLIAWFDGNEWSGKASDLLSRIEDHAGDFDKTKIERLRKNKGWPADGIRVSMKLRRLSGFLRRLGIGIFFPGPTDKTRTLRLQKVADFNAHNALNAQTQRNQQLSLGVNSGDEGDEDFNAQLTPKEKHNDFSEMALVGDEGDENGPLSMDEFDENGDRIPY